MTRSVFNLNLLILGSLGGNSRRFLPRWTARSSTWLRASSAATALRRRRRAA